MLPDKAIITPAKPADRTQMNDLVVEEEDALNVFDRAYVDYKKFGSYCEKSIRFVSRLKSNALVEVVEEFPTNPESNIKEVFLFSNLILVHYRNSFLLVKKEGKSILGDIRLPGVIPALLRAVKWLVQDIFENQILLGTQLGVLRVPIESS